MSKPAARGGRVERLPQPVTLDQFEMGVTLGTGSFGRVRFVVHKVSGLRGRPKRLSLRTARCGLPRSAVASAAAALVHVYLRVPCCACAWRCARPPGCVSTKLAIDCGLSRGCALAGPLPRSPAVLPRTVCG